MKGAPVIMVGIAELRVAALGYRIRTSGLGSCIGLTLFDPIARIAGLVHVMLPTIVDMVRASEPINRAKYADTGVPDLIEAMKKLGAKQARFEAKMAGGAQMFAVGKNQPERLRIGERNIEACKKVLREQHIRLIAEDTGGIYGRTIEIDAGTGRLMIRSVSHGIKEI
ncbi:MAG: chemotaxis protein CheD [Paenibacillaceae bacterium]|nr:chemotaxis protein CheD [Paenibacillaceae bacterium]